MVVRQRRYGETRTRPNLHQPLPFELLDRFPHRRAAETGERNQLLLGHQRAGRQLERHDQAFEPAIGEEALRFRGFRHDFYQIDISDRRMSQTNRVGY